MALNLICHLLPKKESKQNSSVLEVEKERKIGRAYLPPRSSR